jgi:S1-C subfamily serine protease
MNHRCSPDLTVNCVGLRPASWGAGSCAPRMPEARPDVTPGSPASANEDRCAGIMLLPPHSGDPHRTRRCDDQGMSTVNLTSISEDVADIVSGVAPSVVQVQGRRRPASGVAYTADTVITTVRALGRENGLRIRTSDDRTLDAELAGWDPATGLALVRPSRARALRASAIWWSPSRDRGATPSPPAPVSSP